MIKCGLLGRSLAHSYSPQIHSRLGNYAYHIFEKEPESLEEFLQVVNFTGINVTIPYKKAVLPYCAELTPIAKRLGAVNTIVRRKDGSLLGHNTDYFGFFFLMKRLGIDLNGKKALILGSGGASNTVFAVLEDLGAIPVVISRTGENNYQNLHLHYDAACIVNTTPVGMYPNTDGQIIDLDDFPVLEAVADLIYNPARTRLLMDAEMRGLKTENGLYMLVAQAKQSAEFFTGCSISDSVIDSIHHALKLQMENIVLIGMPGCGKTTVGTALALKLNRTFIDTDQEIEAMCGCSIPEIFRTQGEAGFRKLETEVLSRFSKESGLIIATGGGCVTKEENSPLLHANSRIIWLKREIDKLPKSGRPLSLSHDLQTMYKIREPLYQRFADSIIYNDASVDDTVDNILNDLENPL